MFAKVVRCALAPAALMLIAAPAAAKPCHTSLFIASTANWPPPLDREVSFNAGEISLREALDRLAAASRVRISYSGDALPLDRTVCINAESAALGAVLERLLTGISVDVVSAGGDQVVITPCGLARPSMMMAPVVLDRIVVTGNASGSTQRRLPLAVDVLDGRELERRRVFTLSSAFGGSAPGVWLWSQAPGTMLLRYGSIRGASSFGLSYPKTFIDGIEVANPLLVTHLTPESIESIELIRGPHGSALYGADAISGVMNVTTRLEQPREGAPRLALQSQAGLMNGESGNPALATENVLTLNAGGGSRSLRLTGELGSDGGYVPNAFSRRLTLAASARSVAEKSILTGTLRFYGHEARSPVSPILIDTAVVPDSIARRLLNRNGTQQVTQYTAGFTMKLLPSQRWRHTLTVGADGYSLDGIFDDGAPIPSAADSALREARGDAVRSTLRWSTAATLGQSERLDANVTVTADHSLLRQQTTALARSGPGSSGPGPGPVVVAELTRWRNTTGAGAMVNTGILGRVFVNGGLRLERSAGSTVTLPTLGGAWMALEGDVTLKLRAAYGKGIRYPETPIRETLQGRLRVNTGALALEPEEQSGAEAGFDLIFLRGLSLTVTRFDQTASGLIQRVMLPGDTGSSGPGPRERVRYQLQNVGAIANKGWELQGTIARGPLSITGAYSLVDSRVERLATGYAGDLQPGDRMLEVPRRTMSLSASWSGSPWFASITAWRAEDWINYDRLTLTADFAADTTTGPNPAFSGAGLRSYWREYPGVTHLDAALTWPFARRFQLSMIASNLLDRQRGEPDNITLLPGRTISLGVRGAF